MNITEKSSMDGFTKPAISRIARAAGVKSMADDCTETIRNIIGIELNNVIDAVLVVNDERQTRTIMPEDVYEALKLLGHNLAHSDDLSANPCTK